jgi:hypothetical protein
VHFSVIFYYYTTQTKNLKTMKTSRIFVGTLVAGVLMFLLGGLIYGVLLMDFMAQNCDHSTSRPEDQMIWWALIASNFTWGLLLTVIIDWSGRFTPANGARVGAVLGLLSGLGFDLAMYAMSTMFHNFTVIIVDCIGFSVMFALAGLVTGWVMGKMNRTAAV